MWKRTDIPLPLLSASIQTERQPNDAYKEFASKRYRQIGHFVQLINQIYQTAWHTPQGRNVQSVKPLYLSVDGSLGPFTATVLRDSV
jgi:hypothetical protein